LVLVPTSGESLTKTRLARSAIPFSTWDRESNLWPWQTSHKI